MLAKGIAVEASGFSRNPTVSINALPQSSKGGDMKNKRKSLRLPGKKKCQSILKEKFSELDTQPDEVESIASILRTAKYKGHSIKIKTSYEITIDGRPYKGSLMVGDDGHLHCHSIPYETYGSAIDFVKNLIDIYPSSFPSNTANGGCDNE